MQACASVCAARAKWGFVATLGRQQVLISPRPDIQSWLDAHGLGRYAESFAAQDITLDLLPDLLVKSMLSHNFFIFCEAGLKGNLATGELKLALAYCDKLESFMGAEPFPWGEFVVARGRALVRWARGERAPELVERLTALRQQALDAQCYLYLPEIDAALAQA